MKVDFFTKHPFSVEYQSKNYDLKRKDVVKIVIAAIAGAAFFIIGGLFAFYGASYYLRKRKLEKLSKDSNPQVQKTNDVAMRFALNANTSPDVLLKATFIGKMQSSMGTHLTDDQQNTLYDFFDQAMKTSTPRKTLETLIDKDIPTKWEKDKAERIKTNLLPIMPEKLSTPLQNEVKKIAQTGLVCFYKHGPTEFLGNFAICPQGIKLWGQTFKCSEAAFQWRKYYFAAKDNNRNDLLNDPEMVKFFNCDGEEAFQLRQELDKKYPNVFAKGWLNGRRDDVMWEILQAKFQQNPEMKELLNVTGSAYLLEHNQKINRDKYWSDNKDGTGKNMLGRMLMAIRDGGSCPDPNDVNEQSIVKVRANHANQPRALNYEIF